jgi:REP element-mobilizing transposase RayT
MSTIVNEHKGKTILINGVEDHVHALLSLNPSTKQCDIVRHMKANSSKFVNEKKLTRNKFEWQAGYGSFTFSKSQMDRVFKYVQNQEEHHKKTSFKDEYMKLLDLHEIDYDVRYVFDD